jgi:hypothetical protein
MTFVALGMYGRAASAGTCRLARIGEAAQLTEVTALSQHHPHVVRNAVDDEYMLVWWSDQGGPPYSDIWGRRLDALLQPLGPNFPITEGNWSKFAPVIAHDGGNNQYLVTWWDNETGAPIASQGQLLSANGTLIGTPFPTGPGAEMSLLYYGAATEYFLTGRGYGGIYGQRISPQGALIGPQIQIGSLYASPNGDIAVDPTRNRYFATWGDETAGDLRGRVLAWDGTLLTPQIIISPIRSTFGRAAAVAFDHHRDRYLVVFASDQTDYIRGQFVDPDGGLIGGEFMLGLAPYEMPGPDLVYDDRRRSFILVWAHFGTLYARAVHPDGSVSPDVLAVTEDAVDDPYSMRIVHDAHLDEYLVVWEGNRTAGPGQIYGQRIACVGACCDAGENCSTGKPADCTGNFYDHLECGSLTCSSNWCDTAVVIACGQTLANATQGGGRVDAWGCNSLSYAGASEMVYRITHGTGGDLTIEMNYTHGPANDLDLFLLASCDPADCVAQSIGTTGNELITLSGLEPGIYYAVVDGYNGLQDGSYHSITVQCMDLCGTGQELICGMPRMRAVDGPGIVAVWCSALYSFSGAAEAVYWINLPVAANLVVEMGYEHSPSNDLDLFLLDTCMPDACLSYSTGVSGYEIVSANELPAGNYFVVVDGYEGRQNGSSHEIIATCSPIGVADVHQPVSALRLEANRPNPFNPATRLAFEIPVDSKVQLAIYDVNGRLVAMLIDSHRDAGRHEVTWYGRDAAGRPLGSGVYFCRLSALGESLTRRMVMVR